MNRNALLGLNALLLAVFLAVLLLLGQTGSAETTTECSASPSNDDGGPPSTTAAANKACSAEAASKGVGGDNADTARRRRKETIHLAGFLPDGYLERAQGQLSDFAGTAIYNYAVRQFSSRKEYQTFLNIQFPGVEIPTSTVLWVEDPVEILGDSDDFAQYYSKCVKGRNRATTGEDVVDEDDDADGCLSVRPFFQKLGDSKIEKQARLAKGDLGGWEHEAHQGVKCSSLFGVTDESVNSFSGSIMPFHIILNRDWNPVVYQSFYDALNSKQVRELPVDFPSSDDTSGQVEAIFWPSIPVLRVPNASELSEKELLKVFQRGTVSTNGTRVRLQLKTVRKTDPESGYVPLGFVPEGDLRRTNEPWVTTMLQGGQATIKSCDIMFGGLRRVQSILATDRMERPES